MTNCRRIVWSGVLVVLASAAVRAEAPQVYSATVVNSFLGPSNTQKIERDGTHAVVETNSAQGNHIRTYYDLQSHKTYSVDADHPVGGCSSGTFSGDWGDPFEMSAGMMKDLSGQNPKQTGSETLNGFATHVLETAPGPQQVKVWLEPAHNLIVKAQMGGRVLIEVKQFSLTKPAASAFVLPAGCAAAPPTESEKFASMTGGNPGDFDNAIMPPASPNSCSVLLRPVIAGSMKPVTTPFQMAIDLSVDPNHMADYSTPVSANGKAAFTGGAIHEVTQQFRNGVLRMDNIAPQFHVEAYFGAGGYSSTLIYRHCASAQTVLLMVIKNPAKLGEGVDWFWVKSGKFAQ